MKYCIDISNMGKKLITKSFSFTCSFDESCNVYKFHICWHNFCSIYRRAKFLKTIIIYIYDSCIWFYSTKRKVCSFCGIGFCKSIKEGRFTDIWKTDDSNLHKRCGELLKKSIRNQAFRYVHDLYCPEHFL